MTKKIKITTLLIAILGLLNELKFLFLNSWNLKNDFIVIILDFFSSISLQFVNSKFFYSENIGIQYNYLHISFYVFLVLSVILFHYSKHKESRILRFLLSLQFLSNVISVIMITAVYFIYKDEFGDQYPIYILIFSLIFKAGFVALTYYFLNYFRKNNELDFTIKTLGEESHNMVVLTRKWQRFFHLIMDSFCIVLLFSFIIQLPIIRREPIFDEEYMFYVLLFIIRTIYYTFFEGILNATPAKLLTESRVINAKGHQPEFLNIFTRTIFRYIPFEAFSFLGEKGWHDKLSNTYVAKEKRIGIKANTYLWIFPILIVGIVTFYVGRYAYVEYQIHERQKHSFEVSKKQVENQIKNISTNTIIEIEPIDYYLEEYSSSQLYLKVENITNNKITASFLIMEDNYNEDILKVEAYYDTFKSVVKKITFDKSDLNKMYATDFETLSIIGVDFFKDGAKFKIKNMHELYEPKLELGSSRGYEQDKIIISLDNKGWKADFMEFKNNSGNIKWKIEETLNYNTNVERLNYTLIGSDYNIDNEIDLIIKMKDQNNKIHSYNIKGDYNNLELNKVE